jgi:hypothetical protein
MYIYIGEYGTKHQNSLSAIRTAKVSVNNIQSTLKGRNPGLLHVVSTSILNLIK